MPAGERREPPLSWLAHYPRMLRAYLAAGEDGLEEIEEELRTRASARPGGKFSKTEAAYVPFVPLPPVEWRHRCGHCRFWVDQGPGEAGECMIVGREGDRFGGKAIHEKAGCALFVPPAGEPAFAWLREQVDPTGADLVRGEFHPRRRSGVEIPVTDEGVEPGPEQAPDAVETRSGAGGPPTVGAAGVAGAAAAGAGPGRTTSRPDVGTDPIPAGTTVGLERIAGGMAAPVDLAFDPGADRIFVADQAGLVHVVEDGSRRAEPLLDLRERMIEHTASYDERGLLGLALHPGFPDDGRLFVRYSAPPRAGTPPNYDHTEVLAAFHVDGDGSPVDPDEERALLEIPHPEFNHNAGDVAFGPDGYLYVSMGDGGGEGDVGVGHVDGGNGQDVTENVLGSVLRIDVDERRSSARGAESGDVDAAGEEPPEWTGADAADPRGDEPYAVPDDNPLAGDGGAGDPTAGGEGIDELYAWGLRNPWGMSFDEEGELWVADVGQHLYEEVNVVEAGGNYGWNVREGLHCFDPENPTEPPEECPTESRRGEPLIDPVLAYPHVHGDEVIGSAVVGGARYAGDALADLRGTYVFGDWATTQDRPSGRLFAAREPVHGEPRWELEELVVAGSANGRPNRHVLGFGTGPEGDLYLCSSETHAPRGSTGAVHRFVAPE